MPARPDDKPDPTRPASGPGRRAARSGATTLAELSGHAIGVYCWCNRCSHSATLPLDGLIARLGPGTPLTAMAGRLRCSVCGARDIAARPAWPSLGQVSGHGSSAPPPTPKGDG
jgi:hypothetical protein